MEESNEENNEKRTEESEVRKYDVKIKKKNPWMIVTVVLAVIVIILLVFNPFGGMITGGVIGEGDAASKLMDYLNTIAEDEVSFVSSEDIGDLYKIMVSYMGDEIPVYITKDGEYFVQGIIPLTGQAIQQSPQAQQQPAQDILKSDKPKVELFVFSYCPYSLQFQKAMLSVYELLKDKADMDLIAIGAMHGEYEKIESLRQICIEKEYGEDKLWEYIKEFAGNTDIGDCRGDEDCTDSLIKKILSDLKINKDKINSCMDKDAEKIYQEQNSRAKELGISGSPTFVINDVKVQVSRTSEAIKEIICSAFTESPVECGQTLSDQAVSPWFGYSAGTDTSAQC